MADYKRGDTASWDAQQVRRGQADRQRSHQTTRRRKRRRFNPLTYLLLVLVTSAILAGVGWMLASDLCAFNKEPITATVKVTADDDMGSISDKLEEAGLIEYKWFFKLFAGVAHAQEKIGVGTYELNTDMDYRALIMGMRNASGNLNTDTVRVTIPEGYTVAQTIHLLAEKGVNTEEALLDAAANYDLDRKSTRLNSSHSDRSRMPSSA